MRDFLEKQATNVTKMYARILPEEILAEFFRID